MTRKFIAIQLSSTKSISIYVLYCVVGIYNYIQNEYYLLFMPRYGTDINILCNFPSNNDTKWFTEKNNQNLLWLFTAFHFNFRNLWLLKLQKTYPQKTAAAASFLCLRFTLQKTRKLGPCPDNHLSIYAGEEPIITTSFWMDQSEWG